MTIMKAIGSSILGMLVCLIGLPVPSKIKRVSFFFIITIVD